MTSRPPDGRPHHYPYLNNNDDRKRDGGRRVAMGSSSRSEDDGPGPGAAVAAAGANKGGNGNHLMVPDTGGGGGSGGGRPYSPVAETLFRKDLISAMKLPDNEPLTADDYWMVADTWKQEWEKGVQVPVKPEELKEPHVSKLKKPPHSANKFQFPRKLLCMNQSSVYTSDTHQITPMALRAEQVCSYDLDDVDQRWLGNFNGERALCGASTITELEMERAMEELERQCWQKIHSTLKSNEEEDADDGVICDVCRSPDSEECNVMVFCEKCNICVHQACYGITSIPSGPWVCRTCSLGIKPKCELCPNRGGAMKSTKSGQKWAHVSCALWIPEVNIGCVEKMEPITKISGIPQSRWNLVCALCKERVGSCIQCSVKTCKTAYHVTCAFKRGLEMRAIIEDDNAEDGVKLRSYCQKHSLNQKRRDSDDSDDEKRHMTAEERTLARREKLIKIESEFYKHVDLAQASRKIGMDSDLVDFIFRYWLLKRKSGGNKPLLAPRSDEVELLSVTNQETEREKLKRFVALRQDLERVRNLCYMVSRREKLQRSWVKLREQILANQLQLLTDKTSAQQMSLMEMSAILEANHGPSIYDRLYSHRDAEQHDEGDFEAIVARISGEIAENSARVRKDNPYRASGSGGGQDSQSATMNAVSYERIFSDMSASETDDILNLSASLVSRGRKGRPSKKGASVAGAKAKKPAAKAKAGKRPAVTRSDSSDITDASDDDAARKTKKDKGSGAKNAIFSDTDSDDEKSKLPKAATFRTKAAMKDFSVDEITRSRKGKEKAKLEEVKAKSRGRPKKVPRPNSSEDEVSGSDDEAGKMLKDGAVDESEFYPMIVPERAAARKAAARLKATEQRVAEVVQPEVYDFDEFDTVANNIPKDVVDALKEPPKSYIPPSSSAHLASSKYKSLFNDSDSLDSLSDYDQKLKKKGKKSKVSPGSYGFVPERKAAKKASAHLKEGGRGASTASAREESPSKSPKKSPGRPRKKDHVPSISERIRLSDSDSDREPFPYKSPRGKSPRGRGAPKKLSVASARASSNMFPRPRPVKNKALSSRAEAILSQRSSQLEDIFAECGLGSKSSKGQPDKKLKTSEGRPDGGQSPPADTNSLENAGGDRKSSSGSSSSDSSSSSSSSSSEDERAPRTPGRKEADQHERTQSAASQPAAASPGPLSSPAAPATPAAKEDADADLLRRRRRRSGDLGPGLRGGDLHSPAATPATAAPATPASRGFASPTGSVASSFSAKGASFTSPRSEPPSGGGEVSAQQKTPGGSIFSPSRSPLSQKESPRTVGGRGGHLPNAVNARESGLPQVSPSQALSKGGDGKHLQQPLPEVSPKRGVQAAGASMKSPELMGSRDLESTKQVAESRTTAQPKQTDDSGFDSDEKAQQNQLQAEQQQQSLMNERLGGQHEKHNHFSQQNQQQQQQQQQQGRQWSQMQQQNQFPALANLDPYQREQAMQYYNSVYDMHRKNASHMGYPQNAHNQAFQNFNNVDFLQQLQHNPQNYHQYLQLMQQQMQLYGAAGAPGNHLKDLQMLEQLFSQGYGTSSWQANLSAAEMMSAAMAGQQSQNQQQQNLQKQSHVHQKQMPASSQASYFQQKDSSSSTHPSSSSFPHAPSSGDQFPSASKVQSSSSQPRRSSKESPGRRPAQSPRGGPAHYQHEPGSSVPPTATPADALPGYTGTQKEKMDSQQEFSISKDLLGEVAGLNKLPVWKPSSERDSNSSPQKTPDDRGRDSMRRASNDRNFDDLMRRVGSSPSQGLKDKMKPHTPAHSESKESQDHSVSDVDRASDYDDMKGGVDYDDYDFDDDYKAYKSPAPRKRGRGRPRGAGRGLGRGRGRPKVKPAVIDTKALEAVHKTVAGTDYDFEDEFGSDDFGDKKSGDLSLQALREQTKRQNAILDAQKDDPDAVDDDPASAFDFEHDFEKVKKVAAPPAKTKRGRGAAASARGRGRGRGRPKKTPSVEPPSPAVSSDENEAPQENSAPPPPRLPKLKLGALLIKKESPINSPKVSKSKADKKSSSDKEVRVPKLKIKFGGRPPIKPDNVEPVKEDPPAAVKKSENDARAAEDSIAETTDANKAETTGEASESRVEQAASQKGSPSSPSKKGSKIDFLASKLMDAKKDRPAAVNSDVATIFGPSKPLDMTAKSGENQAKSSTQNQTEDKSELDLLQEEMKSLQQKPPPNHESGMPPKKREAIVDDDYGSRSQHLKMKFKRHTTTPDPVSAAAASSASSSSSSAAHAAPAAPPDIMQSVHPRMRKKEILSKYFGGDAYPAPPANGPTSANPVEQPQPQAPPQPAVRSFIKMPKAVASVTSVPTRADYQQQLDANMERKRKLKGLESGPGGNDSAGGKGAGGKKKKGRPKQDADDDFKSKTVDAASKKEAGEKKEGGNGRKTRGKPPKKCLAEDDHDVDSGDLKAESMKFAEMMMASFEKDEDDAPTKKAPAKKGRPKKTTGGKRKNANPPDTKNVKKPRIVIKFSKDSKNAEETPADNAAAPSEAQPGGKNESSDKPQPKPKQDAPAPPGEAVNSAAVKDSVPAPAAKQPEDKKNNGLDEYNFDDDEGKASAPAAVPAATAGGDGKDTPPPPNVDGNVDLVDMSKVVPKLRIKF